MTFAIAPSPVVPDASVIIDGLLAEPYAEEAIGRWVDTGRMLLVPPIAWLEIANVLVRRRGMSAEVAAAKLGLLFQVGVDTADRGYGGLRTAVDLADRHGLSAYDASYLALAIEIDAELATRDRALAKAAEAEGVTLAIKIGD